MDTHYYTKFSSPIGTITAVADNTAIVYVSIGDKTLTDPRFHAFNAKTTTNPLLITLQECLFDDSSSLPLKPKGTPFQHSVWQALRAIPKGKTMCYADIAETIGNPRAVRAVGSACGANPIAVLIPCHRIVHKNGKLSGYSWGVEVQKQLLTMEAAMPQ